ncbi:MAG TPA: hypothetical protein VMV35_10710 [Halothiobacillus sp.]|nr:hypothetical protein [Halothiobacillus sp.]
MTTVSNKLTAGLDKVRDTKPAEAPAIEKSTQPKAPVRRKPEQPKSSGTQAAEAVQKQAIPAARVWPD